MYPRVTGSPVMVKSISLNDLVNARGMGVQLQLNLSAALCLCKQSEPFGLWGPDSQIDIQSNNENHIQVHDTVMRTIFCLDSRWISPPFSAW